VAVGDCGTLCGCVVALLFRAGHVTSGWQWDGGAWVPAAGKGLGRCAGGAFFTAHGRRV